MNDPKSTGFKFAPPPPGHIMGGTGKKESLA